jgi:hypothetical protein
MDRWSEELRCPQCNNTGVVSFSQAKDTYLPIVDRVPDGFKTVPIEYGPNFQCGICDVPVEPQRTQPPK